MRDEDVVAAGAGAVVVGVDDSEGGRTAVAHALREAARRGVGVLAVMAYDFPELLSAPIGPVVDRAGLMRELGALAQDIVDSVVADARAECRDMAEVADLPEVRVAALSGSAAEVLCRVSRGAALLVVGHRGRGGLASRLIGSVGLGVVVHAACPVLVVRPTPTATQVR